jgi:hypothetical protein
MAVATETTQVQVESGAAAVETTRSSVAGSVDNSQISNLGLKGRDFLQFLLPTPGVTEDVRTGDLSFGRAARHAEIASRAEYPTLPALDRGPSVNDQRHRVITNFVWNLDYFHGLKSPPRYLIDDWNLSAVILAQSGQPYSNDIGGDSVNDTNSQTGRVP